MNNASMGRREFLRTTAAATLAAGAAGSALTVSAAEPAAGVLKKALQLGMLPKGLSDEDKFKLAKECGYAGIEASPMADLDAAKKVGETARAAGIRIHSVLYGGWDAPFSDPDPAVVEKGLKGKETQKEAVTGKGSQFRKSPKK